MKKIVVCFPCNEAQKEKFKSTAKAFPVSLIFLQEIAEEKRYEQLTSASIIIGEPSLEQILANPNLEWVQMTWAGTDIYTTKKALETAKGFPKQVRLTNASGAFGVIMAEYAIGAILAMYRNFPVYWRQQQEGNWKDAGAEESLYGKRVLLLGTGDIGTQLALRCKAFGATTIGFRRNPSSVPEGFDEMHSLSELDTWLETGDVIACSLPNKPNTRGLLHKDRLYCMKRDAILLNMGRGTLLDCDELYQVMSEGRLRAAVLDVTNPEPLPSNHPLWKLKNVMITPHIAGPSIGHCEDTQNRIVEICCENIKRYFTNTTLLHTIEDTDFEYER